VDLIPALSPGAPLLQALVTLGLALVLLHLHHRNGKPHFLWWAVALFARLLSVVAIVTFMLTGRDALLFLHQVFIAWTALGFLYAAQVFSRQLAWDRRFLVVLALPVAWAYVAIFVLERFALAAGPAVVFLALATAWAGFTFLRYRQRTGSPAAGFLATVLFLWAVHHLDYPLLRARGAWDPWGYYLDILFTLAMGGGILLLVIEEQREGLKTLTALSGDLRSEASEDSRDVLLTRPLGLRGVRGAALLRWHGGALTLVRGVGDCAEWREETLPAPIRALATEAATTGRSRMEGRPTPAEHLPPFAAALPLGPPVDADAPPRDADGTAVAVLVIVGEVAAPFAALDDSILTVVGEQVGHALERAELSERLARRTEDLEHLSVRMLQEHESQRRRLGRELHDETAQVFSALKLQLGLLREESPAALHARFDRLIAWVDRGTGSVRAATDGLRPALLDDLGLLPALRALAAEVREWSGLVVDFESAGWPASARGLLSRDAEVALFRAQQEALSNVARHARATRTRVALALAEGHVQLRITDDGIGIPADAMARLTRGPGRSGLVGMRERLTAVGGRLALAASPTGGLTVAIDLPVEAP
jgi:signal transduction histidine kinase